MDSRALAAASTDNATRRRGIISGYVPDGDGQGCTGVAARLDPPDETEVKHFQKNYQRGEMDMEKIEASPYSWLGHAEYGGTWGLRKKLLDGFILTRGEKNEAW